MFSLANGLTSLTLLLYFQVHISRSRAALAVPVGPAELARAGPLGRRSGPSAGEGRGPTAGVLAGPPAWPDSLRLGELAKLKLEIIIGG